MFSLKKFVVVALSFLLVYNPLYASSSLVFALQKDKARFASQLESEEKAEAEVSLTADSAQQLEKFNKKTNSSWRVRMNEKRQAPRSMINGKGLTLSASERGALSFLKANKDFLNVNPKDLKLKLERTSSVGRHFYFDQYYKGIRVENAYVKVNVGKKGELLNYQSTYIPDLDLSLKATISGEGAKTVALSDCGGSQVLTIPEKVIFLNPETEEYVLAWKLTVIGGSSDPGKWVYFVSAEDSKILNRVSRIFFATETFSSNIYPVYPGFPGTSGKEKQKLPVEDLNVFAIVVSTTTTVASSTTVASTAADGTVDLDDDRGRVFTTFTGKYFTVTNQSNSEGNGSYYIENNDAKHNYKWEDAPTSEETFSACEDGKYPAFSTPIFASTFSVGEMNNYGEITKKVFRLVYNNSLLGADGLKREIGAYIGVRNKFFYGPIIPNADDSQTISFGFYGVDSSAKYSIRTYNKICVHNSPITGETRVTDHIVADNSPEASAYYNLTQIRNFFQGTDLNNTNSYINLEEHLPVQVNAFGHPYVSPEYNGMTNAFYDEDANLFMYGQGKKGSNAGGDYYNFALEAGIVRHEYVHYVMSKIWPVYYSGAGAAVAEAFADYFALSSSVDSSGNPYTAVIGDYVQMTDNEGNLSYRSLGETTTFNSTTWAKNNDNGDYYKNSVILSQILWKIRKDSTLKTYADKIAWTALMFFPDSVLEFRDAVLTATKIVVGDPDGDTAVSKVEGFFIAHNVKDSNFIVDTDDTYEPNNSPASAADIGSALSSKVLSAKLFPASDVDSYSLTLPEGEFKAVLHLPLLEQMGPSYLILGMALLDANLKTVVSETLPLGVNIGESDITTPYATSTLSYKVPARLSGESSKYVLVVYKYSGAHYPAEPTDSSTQEEKDTYNKTGFYTIDLTFAEGSTFGSVTTQVFNTSDPITFSVPYSTAGVILDDGNALPDVLADWRPDKVESFYSARLLGQDLSALKYGSEDIEATETTPSAGNCLTITDGPTYDETNKLITGAVQIGCDDVMANNIVYLQIFGKLRSSTSVQASSTSYSSRYAIISLGISNPLANSVNSGRNVFLQKAIFNPALGGYSTIEINPKENGSIKVQVFTLDGLLVKTIYDGPATKGVPIYEDWDGKNGDGYTVASGIYLLRVDGAGITKELKKIVVVK